MSEFLKIPQKPYNFRLLFGEMVLLNLAFGADLDVKVVPEWVCVIAASLTSVKMALVGQNKF